MHRTGRLSGVSWVLKISYDYFLIYISYCVSTRIRASYLACASHITFHVTHHHVIGSIEKGTYQAVKCNMECTLINCHLSYENLKAAWLLHWKMCLSGGNCVNIAYAIWNVHAHVIFIVECTHNVMKFACNVLKFSKVSFWLSLRYKLTLALMFADFRRVLTFEDFQQGVSIRACAENWNNDEQLDAQKKMQDLLLDEVYL